MQLKKWELGKTTGVEMSTSFNDVVDAITEESGKIAANIETTNALTISTTDLDTRVTDLEGLNADITKLQGETLANKTELGDLDTEVSQVKTTVGQHTTLIDGLTTSTDSNTTKISDLEAKVDLLEGDTFTAQWQGTSLIITDGDGAKAPVNLVGPAGADGQDGAKGEKGDKGDQGLPGTDGVDGVQGPKGDAGQDGVDGLNGTDGESAYELAVAAGYVGTEAQWLASLKGEKGDKGDNGTPGAQGADGAQGPKGDKGDKGDQGDSIFTNQGAYWQSTTRLDVSGVKLSVSNNGELQVGNGSTVDMGGNRVQFVATPTQDQDAANKAYVDGKFVQGIPATSDGGTGWNVSTPVDFQGGGAQGYTLKISGGQKFLVDGTNTEIKSSQVTLDASNLSTNGTITQTNSTTYLNSSTLSADTSVINLNGSTTLIGLQDPTNAQDAATKAYVDAEIAANAGGDSGLAVPETEINSYYDSAQDYALAEIPGHAYYVAKTGPDLFSFSDTERYTWVYDEEVNSKTYQVIGSITPSVIQYQKNSTNHAKVTLDYTRELYSDADDRNAPELEINQASSEFELANNGSIEKMDVFVRNTRSQYPFVIVYYRAYDNAESSAVAYFQIFKFETGQLTPWLTHSIVVPNGGNNYSNEPHTALVDFSFNDGVACGVFTVHGDDGFTDARELVVFRDTWAQVDRYKVEHTEASTGYFKSPIGVTALTTHSDAYDNPCFITYPIDGNKGSSAQLVKYAFSGNTTTITDLFTPNGDSFEWAPQGNFVQVGNVTYVYCTAMRNGSPFPSLVLHVWAIANDFTVTAREIDVGIPDEYFMNGIFPLSIDLEATSAHNGANTVQGFFVKRAHIAMGMSSEPDYLAETGILLLDDTDGHTYTVNGHIKATSGQKNFISSDTGGSIVFAKTLRRSDEYHYMVPMNAQLDTVRRDDSKQKIIEFELWGGNVTSDYATVSETDTSHAGVIGEASATPDDNVIWYDAVVYLPLTSSMVPVGPSTLLMQDAAPVGTQWQIDVTSTGRGENIVTIRNTDNTLFEVINFSTTQADAFVITKVDNSTVTIEQLGGK